MAAELPRIGALVADRYRIAARIGEGGMGAVYAADHVILRKRVAIKFLRPESAGDQSAVRRLHREAQAATAVGHRGVVEVYDVGWTEDRIPFIVMEYLHGESLEQILYRELRLEPAQAIEVARQTLATLVAVHGAAIVHRDIKPANVFVARTTEDGQLVKLLDFGISRIQGDDFASKITSTGMILGTPYYMAPEMAAGEKDIDGRVDIWAMGVILYESLTGRVPYEASSYNALLASILTAPFEPPRSVRPDVPEDLERVILKAMTKDRSLRYQRAADFLEDLLACDVAKAGTSLPRATPAGLDAPPATVDGPTEMDLAPPQLAVDSVAPAPSGTGRAGSDRSRRAAPLAVAAILGATALGVLLLGLPRSSIQERAVGAEDRQGAPASAARPSPPPDARARREGESTGPTEDPPDARPDAASADRGPRRELALAALEARTRPLRACLVRGTAPQPRLRVRVRVEPSGELRYDGASPSPSTEQAACLGETIGAVTLPAAPGPAVSVTLSVERPARPGAAPAPPSGGDRGLEPNPFQ